MNTLVKSFKFSTLNKVSKKGLSEVRGAVKNLEINVSSLKYK